MENLALLQAAEIVNAGFAALGVNAFDPLNGSLAWKNNTLTPGATVVVGFLFGKYKPDTRVFSVLIFDADGTTYGWGSAKDSATPSQGSSKSDSLPTYALNLPEEMTLDVLAFIATGTLGKYSTDFDSGNRVIGLNWSNFNDLNFIATKVFEGVVTVTPYQVAAEITGFSIAKA